MNTPCLDLWNERMRMGYRGQKPGKYNTWVLDNLWRAAAWEASAVELEAMGCHDSAARCLSEAERLILEAPETPPHP